MKKTVLKIYNQVGIHSSRTKNIVNHVGLSFIFKGGSILANFLLVPLTINYLDTANYGIWITLSSFISWFAFFDIGLGNGLRNKFAEAKATGNYKLAHGYVSSAYFTIALICTGLFLLFYFINFYVDWTSVFNTDKGLKGELSILMPVLMSFFCLQMVVKLITTIYVADQHHSVEGMIQFISQWASLILIWLLTKTTEGSLLIFGSLYSALPVLILFGLNIVAFKGTYKKFKPSFSLWNKEYVSSIMGIGFSFFIIQIAVFILFSTDNFIIIKLFGPEEVVPYHLAFKYFSIISMVFTIIVAPYWSTFTEAYITKDFAWIKKSVSNILKIWTGVPFILIIMVLLADKFYSLWVGDMVQVPLFLSISMALFVLLNSFITIFAFFINGVGKIRLQLINSVISMSINIPLSILFARTFDLGISGVILATCFCLGYPIALWPIQYYKIVNNKAKGIWNK